jgi:hypothetical protein
MGETKWIGWVYGLQLRGAIWPGWPVYFCYRNYPRFTPANEATFVPIGRPMASKLYGFPVEIHPGGYQNWRVRWVSLLFWVITLNLLIMALLYAF